MTKALKKNVGVLAVSLLVLLALSSPLAYSDEPPSEPILRIETQMHTAMITRIGIDTAEKFIVTASNDKTIRIWDLKTGNLLKVFRPPIGAAQEGRIYAVAISPDGSTLAAAGWTAYEWDGTNSIYLFQRETGKLFKRIPDLPSVINHLAFSRDGRFLAAGIGQGGIRIYETAQYTQIKEDIDYQGEVYGFDFGKDGKLVTGSYDRNLRLYDRNFNLIKKVPTQVGERPFHISYSPDGSRIAVGFQDQPLVEVYSFDLEYLYTPDCSETTYDLATVCWSADGKYLYAAGRYWNETHWGHPVRRWSDKGRGPYQEFPAAEDSILQILPLKQGGIVFGSAEPSFGIIDSKGERPLYRQPESVRFLRTTDSLYVSNDGSRVKFGYEGGEILLDVEGKEVIQDPEEEGSLEGPIQEHEELEILDWFHSEYPQFNGIPLELESYETCRSLAIAPDGSGFVLGTDWYLRVYDSEGEESWTVPVPGAAWAVNISRNGKVIVATLDDGTVRWYRMEDGEEILSFFLHQDLNRWILWTPLGYYDASVGGEDLIGWHINTGKEKEADFYPASRFRELRYRPDVISYIFTTYDEEKAIAFANEQSGREEKPIEITQVLPPKVQILSPKDGTTVLKNQVTVQYKIENPSEEKVTALRVLVDGRPIETSRGLTVLPQSEKIAEITVPVPERDCELSLVAENAFAVGEPATIRLFWKGEKKKEDLIKPKLYVLSVGVSAYQLKDLRLQYAAKDAEDFFRVIKTQKGKLYQDVVGKVLTNEKATKEEILDGLEWIQRETTAKDVAMIFLAGHGVNDPSGIFYFLPQNADPERLKRTAVPFTDIKNTVASLAGKTLLFVDTCHSGNVFGGRRGATDITGVVNELSSVESGAVVFASSTGRQYSLEDSAWGNGAFTKALLEGLSGKADLFGKGKITVSTLEAYIAERVKELTRGKQTPTTAKPQTISDFPLAVP